MSCGLEFFSTEVSAAPPKVIAHVPPNELYVFRQGKGREGEEEDDKTLYCRRSDSLQAFHLNISPARMF
jgi:hypothetical protein